MSQLASDQCQLRFYASGEDERCPRELCAFWEPGGAVVPGRCILERTGADLRHHDIAMYLLEVRERVEAARAQVKGEPR